MDGAAGGLGGWRPKCGPTPIVKGRSLESSKDLDRKNLVKIFEFVE